MIASMKYILIHILFMGFLYTMMQEKRIKEHAPWK